MFLTLTFLEGLRKLHMHTSIVINVFSHTVVAVFCIRYLAAVYTVYMEYISSCLPGLSPRSLYVISIWSWISYYEGSWVYNQ